MNNVVADVAPSSLRADKRRGRLQSLHIDTAMLRSEVKTGGRTFATIEEYLRRYHGLKHFALMGGCRIGTEIVVDIRHLTWWDRLRGRG